MNISGKPEPLPVPLRQDESGTIRIGRSRVTLASVVHFFNEGESAEQLVQSFPTLDLAEVYAVIAYYLSHKAEVDAVLAQQESESEELRRKCEALPGNAELRARLLERKAQANGVPRLASA